MAGQSAGSPKIPARPRTKPIIVETESHHVLPSHLKLGLNGCLFNPYAAVAFKASANALQPIQLVRPALAGVLILC
ncbi:hypothetical protein BGAL_0261g00050 [Botrytis galanthina]|uniref:Uncharacterized protein n=1 Tax=Botrytis galanthina TaxID=278940 RepID=A0A4S8QX83_9HELO|nr:hypothetical protein BGAL_0261g00050 [Botrytis galanthina]